MRHITLITILLIGFQFTCSSQTYRIPGNVKRIVILGNSITYSGLYVSYMDAYLTLRYPGRHIEFINVGLPSETVSGLSEPNHAGGKFPRPDLHERLERILTQTKPDLVFECYGMNDGIYMPFDESRFQKYKEGINWVHEKVTESGIPIVHLTSPVYDERKGSAYANVLDIYSDWLISCRYTANWNVIDIHWPMKKYLEEQRLIDSTFKYAEDGIHPNDIGHWIIAKQILLSLGEVQILKDSDVRSAFSSFVNGESILKLVEMRQEIMRDAWLTSTGHKRPGMKVGLPLSEAQQKRDSIDKQIESRIRQPLLK
ncbi:SGNH/GDSL hydrolase family protein [Chitinophagaceae bacterium LB-8]|uniref:SGNH/GDSL hydrolase family protein n=1 Tax=Paraflavisolibacter caeni TaxID=2982496 RepID=A0A9X3BJ61_9BACT|nr:SGNH/GDSL hydrolase family protein [Paraflavisolibacter caeni]MCU7552382.1 SGNH/GDSL hydrolase family protein [Paraflavisolibacter caeni]